MARRKTIEAAEVIIPKPVVVAADRLAIERQKNLDAEKLDIEVRALAERIGYALPADETNPDLIQRDIAANMRRSVEACLEVGRGLTVLKKACAHGGFLPRLEILGIEHSIAKRFMQAAAKFSNGATSHHLPKLIGSQSKLFELLVLDDEQIDELVLIGQTGELALDDISTMSVKELRAAVREARDQLDAKDEVAKDMQETIRKQQEKIKRHKPTPEFLAKETLEDLGKETVQCIAQISAGLRSALTAAFDAIDEHEADAHTVKQACSFALENVGAALRSLAADFDITPVATDAQAALDPSMAHAISEFSRTRNSTHSA